MRFEPVTHFQTKETSGHEGEGCGDKMQEMHTSRAVGEHGRGALQDITSPLTPACCIGLMSRGMPASEWDAQDSIHITKDSFFLLSLESQSTL